MSKKVLIVKSLIAGVAIAALFAVAGANLYPSIPTVWILAFVGCGVLIVLALASLAIVVGQKWNVFGLNHGGTDPQWMWFGGEPPGLQQERARNELQSQSKS